MIYLLYDLDGTLVTSSRQITDDMIKILSDLRDAGYKNVLVTGGQYPKVKSQIRNKTDLFDMIFTECGAVLHRNDFQIYKKNTVDIIDEHLLKSICDRFLTIVGDIGFGYIGNRVDKRNGLVYLTPVGMKADDTLRSNFIKYESVENFREKLINNLKKLDTHNQIEIVKGGKTGISVYPKGIDKTQVLEHIPNTNQNAIYFFGDNCQIGGNDYPLFTHTRCIGFEVDNYKHCINTLAELFG